MSGTLEEQLAREMATWEAAGLRRQLRDVRPESEARADFTSNDYLGLARHPEVVEGARRALAEHGAGSRASRLLGGGTAVHIAAERAAAEWLGAEAALLFPSGYQANLGVIGALAGRGDALFSDADNHASLIDAARLSRAQVFVHDHLDLDELEQQLGRASGARRRLVLLEGVFGMAGDAPELDRVEELCARHDAWLVLDEAHSIGLLGPRGAGAWAALERGAESRLAARVVPGGKALGVSGAFVVGSATLREHLLNRARSFAFTTAPCPAVAGALAAAVGVARSASGERRRVLALARQLASGLDLVPPAAAIVPVVLGEAERAVEISRRLGEAGLEVGAVRPPTVAVGTSRLRVVLHAFNTDAEVERLAQQLGGVAAAMPRATPTVAAPRQNSLFVVGTDTGIGKTVVSALLLRAARERGPAAYWKPVQTGTDHDTTTVRGLAAASPAELLSPLWSLALPASPHEAAAHAGTDLDPTALAAQLREHQRSLPQTQLIIELAGGLLVPYRLLPTPATQADWLATAGVPLVLVARSGLGTLNHTLLTLEALRARHLEPRALFLVGEPHASNRETLQRLGGIELVFEVPRFESVEPDALAAWLAGHDVAALWPPRAAASAPAVTEAVT